MKSKKLNKLIINEERCKGCQLCISVCPKKVLTVSGDINHKGVHPVTTVEIEDCISCGLCAMMCPDLAITVYK